MIENSVEVDKRAEDELRASIVKGSMWTGIPLFIYLLYFMASLVVFQSREREAFQQLMLNSPAHSAIGESYYSCRNKLFSGTRSECLVQAKEIAAIEGFTVEFNMVRKDINEIIVRSDSGEFHLYGGKFLLVK